MKNGENAKRAYKERGKGPETAMVGNFAETSYIATSEPIAHHPKNTRENCTMQAMTRNERKVYSYLRDMHSSSTTQSIRIYSDDLRISREQVKKALQGLARKGKVVLRTYHSADGHSTLSVTVKEE